MSQQDMSTELPIPETESQSLAELFHLVKSLIPEEQKLVVASPGMKAADAIQLMQKYNFSQLPVVVGDAVLGVFSFRSLTVRMLEMGQSGEYIGDLPVDELMEDFAFVHLTDSWESLLKSLNKDGGVLVGNRDRLEGILTSMDILNYLHSIASPFVVLAEIELSLRRIINACVSDEEWPECVQNCLKDKYSQEEMPSELSEMTFNDYVQIIGHGKNWPLFAIVFGQSNWQRKRTASRLREARDLRNDVFHFKRRLLPHDLKKLADHRKWLQMKIRAFEARQHEKPDTSEDSDQPTIEDDYRLLTRIPVPRGQRQLYKALYDAEAKGMTQDELVKAMGRRDRYDLAGVMGALGRRINGTPGYGQRKKPGTWMVLSWKQTPDGQWRYRLRPKMREALERLNPSWLHEMTP